MAQVHLNNNEEFWIISNGSEHHFGFNTPVPAGPFSKNGQPVSPQTVEKYVSTEDQWVEIDFNNSLFDSNNVQFGLIVGGRPKSRKRN